MNLFLFLSPLGNFKKKTIFIYSEKEWRKTLLFKNAKWKMLYRFDSGFNSFPIFTRLVDESPLNFQNISRCWFHILFIIYLPISNSINWYFATYFGVFLNSYCSSPTITFRFDFSSMFSEFAIDSFANFSRRLFFWWFPFTS